MSLAEVAPLESALDKEIVRLERRVAGALRLLAVFGFVLCTYTALAVSFPLGALLGLLCAAIVGWTTLVRWLLAKGLAQRVLPWVNPIVEVTIPTAVIVTDVTTLGATYALSMSVPLQFYGILTALQVLRLRRWVPAVCGAIAAAEYLGMYWLVLAPRLTADELAQPAYSPQMVFVRAAILVIGGFAASFVASGLRRAVGSASSSTRSQELFGKYRLEGELASGGMGVVFRAQYCPEGGFKRPVALKRVHPHLARADEFVAAFRAEAELCSRLVHSNVVQVLDFGRVEDTYFFAMEFVDGFTLADLVHRAKKARRWVPPRVVAFVGREILSGLHFAHRVVRDDAGERMRVVHRDLNPPNVLVSRAGEIKITDFGIARAIGKSRQLVTASATAGKAPYLSPEQAKGEEIDERADLFATGIILWELTCLEYLFVRDTDMNSARAVVFDDAPSPTTRRDDLNSQWDQFFARALAKEPVARYQSALEMRLALDHLVGDDAPRAEELQEFLDRLPAPAADHAQLQAADTLPGERTVA